MAEYGIPPAFMGYVGFVRLRPTNGIIGHAAEGGAYNHGAYTFRALSADINVTQEITKPDVIDSRYDRTAYQLGPRLVDGSINFPVVYEVNSSGKTLFETMYRYAVTRQPNGLLSDFNLDVKYAATADANLATFVYENCVVNSFSFNVAQSDMVQSTIEVVGKDRKIVDIGADPPNTIEACGGSSGADGGFGTTRIVTWNDARVEISSEAGGFSGGNSVGGAYIRTFDMTINNDVERFFTLNGVLAPQGVAPRKREITGSVVFMGRHDKFATFNFENEKRCDGDGIVKFGYKTPSTGLGCDPSTFDVALPNTVFEIETMSLTNDIFESTVNYHTMPAGGINVCDPLLDNIGGNTFDTYD
jgi:hypothetical protein